MFRLMSLALLALGLAAACSHPERGPAVPRVDTARAMPLGIPNARFFADGDTGVERAGQPDLGSGDRRRGSHAVSRSKVHRCRLRGIRGDWHLAVTWFQQ